MGFLSGLFGPKFEDERLVSLAETAISTDPLVRSPGDLLVHSKKGVLTLEGVVNRPEEKERIEGVVQTALKTTGIKFDHIDNHLRVSTPNNSSIAAR